MSGRRCPVSENQGLSPSPYGTSGTEYGRLTHRGTAVSPVSTVSASQSWEQHSYRPSPLCRLNASVYQADSSKQCRENNTLTAFQASPARHTYQHLGNKHDARFVGPDEELLPLFLQDSPGGLGQVGRGQQEPAESLMVLRQLAVGLDVRHGAGAVTGVTPPLAVRGYMAAESVTHEVCLQSKAQEITGHNHCVVSYS